MRANATLPSLQIIDSLVSNYSAQFRAEEVEITKNKILKSSAKDYEELSAKLRILAQISQYNKADNFLENEQQELVNMSLEDFQQMIQTHIQEDDMFYLIVGDKETQLQEVNKFGKGNAIELDIYGNLIN